MQSRTTRQFWRLFSGLPREVQRDAKRAYRLFLNNPAHPGLQFKKLEGEDNLYSARVGLSYRALAVKKEDSSLCDYDHLIQCIRFQTISSTSAIGGRGGKMRC